MKSLGIAQKLAAIRALIKNTSGATAADFELQAHWARYACVLAAGLLENALVSFYSDFVRRNAHRPVVDYATGQIASIQNPKTSKFIDVSRSFKRSWGDDLQQFVETDGRKEAIDGIMANRHLIVHGKDSGITVATVSAYLDKAEEVLKFIEKQLA